MDREWWIDYSDPGPQSLDLPYSLTNASRQSGKQLNALAAAFSALNVTLDFELKRFIQSMYNQSISNSEDEKRNFALELRRTRNNDPRSDFTFTYQGRRLF